MSSSCVSAKMTFSHVFLKIPLSGPAFSAVDRSILCLTETMLVVMVGRNFEKVLNTIFVQ